MPSSTRVVVPAFDSAGAPLTGLSPTWSTFRNVADGTARTPEPTITALAGGLYGFAHGLAADEAFAGVIDFGSTAFPRYVPVTCRYEDTIAATTGDVPSAATVATAVRSELTTELGRVDAAISSRAVTGAAMTLANGAVGVAQVTEALVDEIQLGLAKQSDLTSAVDIANAVETVLSQLHGDGAWGASGNGAESVGLTVYDDAGNPIGGALVTIRSGATKVAGPTATTPGGVATFGLNAGTYTVAATAPGHEGATLQVTVSATDTISPSTLTLTALTDDLRSRVGIAGTCSITAPAIGATIGGITAGEDVRITRTCTAVTSGETITAATLKVGSARASGSSWTDFAGTVSDTGADGTGAFRFDLTPAQTRSFARGSPHDYLVTVTLSGGKTYVVERGRFTVLPG